jgi:uncharacterized membrane-anchored protein
MKKLARGLLAALGVSLGLGLAAHAADAPPENPAWAEAKAAAKAGPADIAIAGQATLHLPADRVFIPQPQAGKLLTAMGNPGTHTELAGLIFPQGDAQWFATLRYIASGYVKDGDAKEWKADELLASYKEGTEAGNEERKKMGVAPLEITGWAEVPAYEAKTHRLVWAMSSKEKGAPADAGQGVNYNTYALGREGYLSLNFVTDLKDLAGQKPDAKALLGALEFDSGKRYEDFNEATDHVAEYGLAALVLGVGAKKLGLLAVIFAFVAKFAKVIFIAVIGLGAVVGKFFKRNKPAA